MIIARTPIRYKIMFTTIVTGFLIWIGACGNSRNVVAIPIKEQPRVSELVFIPLRVDTPKIKPSVASLMHDSVVISKVHLNAQYSEINDTLFKRNLELQRITIRVIDRARETRLQKDSALIVAKQIRDTANARYVSNKVARESQHIVNTSKNINDKIILFCLIICTLGTVSGWVKPYFQKKYIE